MKKYFIKNWKLVCILILCSILVTSVTFSIFKNTTTATGSLVASTWSVSLNQTGVNDTLSVIPGQSGASYTLNVHSQSQVDIIYTIVVSNVPANVQVSLDNGTFQTPQNGTVTFTDAGTIAYNASGGENTHTITFSALSNATPSQNNTIDIDVIVKQDI